MSEIAPNFPDRNGKPTTYPMAGERIGPAWQWAWERMADRRPRTVRELADEMAASAPGEIAVRTAENLLRRALDSGVVVKGPGRKQPTRFANGHVKWRTTATVVRP